MTLPLSELPPCLEEIPLSPEEIQEQLEQLGDSGTFLDPTNDFSFKKLFNEHHKNLIINFLNSVLDFKDIQKIVQVSLSPSAPIKAFQKNKQCVFDVKCLDQSGNEYIIEMENFPKKGFLKRCEFYGATNYSLQIKEGEFYTKLRPNILIVVSQSNLFPPKEDIISYHETVSRKTKVCYLKNIRYVFVELGKFGKNEQELATAIDEWLYLFTQAPLLREIPNTIKIPEVKEAFEMMKRLNWKHAELFAYLQEKMAKMDRLVEIDEQEKELEKKRAEGLQEGLEKGEAKGRVDERKDIARNMLAQGFDVQSIINVTRLDTETIESLRTENKS